MALGAALAWASYYPFVLWGAPVSSPATILVFPFVAGGAAFAAFAAVSGEGRAFARQWTRPDALRLSGLMLAMQLSVLAATYFAGPVDASLLSLIGDVVATPILAAVLFGNPSGSLRRPAVVVGLLLSLAGGTLAIAGGRHLAAVRGAGWLVLGGTPIALALYFLLSARANETTPPAVVVGQSIWGAALGAIAVAPLLPGGWAGVVHPGLRGLALALANGLLSFYVGPTLYFGAIRREGILVPSMLMTGIPLFTLAFAAGLFAERTPAWALVGIPIAVAGAVVLLRGSVARPPGGGRRP